MYKNKVIAVFGVSQDNTKYGYKIFTTLLARGLSVYGINPKGGIVAGKELFSTLDQLPQQAEVAILVVPPVALAGVVEQCLASGIKEIWFQPGARAQAPFERAQKAGVKAINGCFMAENGFW